VVDPQLTALIADLQLAQDRLRTLRATLTRDDWRRRPSAAAWSPADCVAHLNLTSEALLPRLRAGIEQAGERERRTAARHKRDLIGWFMWKVITPSGGLRTKTRPDFMPSVEKTPEALVVDFERLQSDVIACISAAEGLPIDQIKLASPFDARVRYNLYAALTLVPRHQHRHLLQAERAAGVTAIVPEASALAV
jgi:hypothetical protein